MLSLDDVELTQSDYINLKKPQLDRDLGTQEFTRPRQTEIELRYHVWLKNEEKKLEQERDTQLLIYHYKNALLLELGHLNRIYAYIQRQTNFNFTVQQIKSILRIGT